MRSSASVRSLSPPSRRRRSGSIISSRSAIPNPALTLEVGSVSAKSLAGSVGLELRGSAGGSGALRPFASAALEKDLLGDGRTVRFAQTSAPIIVNSWRLEDRSTGAYGRFSGGGSASLGGSL